MRAEPAQDWRPPLEPDKTTEFDSRVALAAERTLLSWIRTGLAMMGFGFIVARFGLFLTESAALLSPQQGLAAAAPRPPGTRSLLIGVGLVGLGVLVTFLATFEYIAMSRRFCRGVTQIARVPSRLGVIIGFLLAILGIAMTLHLASAIPR